MSNNRSMNTGEGGGYFKREVFFDNTGTTNVTLGKGYGVCYDRSYVTTATGETATDPLAQRDWRVALPTTSNNLDFAGVTTQGYIIPPGGKLIEIYEPGSCCLVYVSNDVTLGNLVTCLVGANAGKFGGGDLANEGFAGRGTAKVLETVDVSDDGYMCLVMLQEGAESGLIQVVDASTGAGGATTLTAGGLTWFDGGDVAADLTATLANGTFVGQMKRYRLETAMAAGDDIAITVTTGVQLDGTTALASLELDADNDDSTLMWVGPHWRLIGNSGTALA